MNAPSLRDRLIEATGGRYIVNEELGRGGMAVVYAATDARLKRAVAIKALPPELAFRGDVKSRFIREAQLAAGLAHPHIVPIYAVDETGGLVYMVMGLVRGESLAQRLHRDGRLPFADARRILRETADALAHAHAHGVIHRDIKPDNILIEQTTGNVLVTDFGIARAMEGDARLTVTGVAVGTPTYMSPEQARGDDDIDGRADVYALGVVGFQMLAGEPPFLAPNTPALLLKHVSEPPPPVTARRPDVPPALAHAVDRALAKDRRERWVSASAMRDALADNAVAPPPAPEPHKPVWALNASVGIIAQRRAEVRPAPAALPPFPAWRGGTSEDRTAWREAKRVWREQVREHQRAWADDIRDRKQMLQQEIRGRRRDRKDLPISERIRKFQRRVIGNVALMLMLFVINAATGEFPWFIFPAIGLSIAILGRAFSLWQDGVTLRDMLRRPAHLQATDVNVKASADPAHDADARARALASGEVLAGSHGNAVRRAAEDERAVQDILRSLSPSDRAQLPDVETTLSALVGRVASLSQALHRLDTDVRPEQLAQIEARLAEARALPDGAAERDRRVTLLERQHATLTELTERRKALAEQLESASLVLHTMRLDLLRLRSAGIANAAADITSVTQEARALSADIGRVLDAAAEVKRL